MLLEEIARIAEAAPFRHLVTPGGYTMSVAMTNRGGVGWVSDLTGYRYDRSDPDTARLGPACPRHSGTLLCAPPPKPDSLTTLRMPA